MLKLHDLRAMQDKGSVEPGAMPFADVNGQHIAYDDASGDGPPVVLGHGFLLDRSMFEH